MKLNATFSILAALLTLASCGREITQQGEKGWKKSDTIVATQFVTALNNVDGTYSTSHATELKIDLGSAKRGDNWFVIYDGKTQSYKAVNIDYLRTITYKEYYSNDNSVASAFRTFETSDIGAGYVNGDYDAFLESGGYKYETVDYLSSGSNKGHYSGRVSGYVYEDEDQITDVSLMAKLSEQNKFFQKAANVSVLYNVSIETSLTMVTLGSKIEKMLSRSSNGELTEADQTALMSDLKGLTGVSLSELQAASENSKARNEVLEKIAAKIGTTSQNLEEKFLPEVFGIVL